MLEFMVLMCVALLSLEKDRGYMLEDKWTFSIKQKRVCLKKKFPIKENGKLS